MKRTYGGVFAFALAFTASQAPAQKLIDLANTAADAEIIGLTSLNKTGHALAAGDVNGDGLADLAIGAPGVDEEVRPQDGRVYVLFGASTFPGVLNLGTASADLEIEGRQPRGGLGTAVAIADINGDGLGDIIAGGPGTDANAGGGAGAVWVFLGRNDFPRVMTVLEADMIITGEAALNGLGETIGSGDINHDGISDILLGVPLANPPNRPGGGKAYVIYGKPVLPATLDLAVQPADLVVWGAASTQFIANAVTAGDVNLDGRDDLIIGDFKADPVGGVDAGRTFIIFGSDTLKALIDFAIQEPHVTISGSARQDHLGFAVRTGDVNGDGGDDVIIGVRRANDGTATNVGKVHVFSGTEFWPKEIDLSLSAADLTIVGGAGSVNFGYALAVGNFNADASADLIVSAPFASPEGRSLAGSAFAILGSPSFIEQSLLRADSSHAIVWGAAPAHTLGNAVAAGDLDGDGLDELIVAAEDAAPSGRVYVFSGKLITRIAEAPDQPFAPNDFRLQQNYPNPFNPTTTIQFYLPHSGHVTLKVYNTRGQEIATLLSRNLTGGAHKVIWNAGGAASGVYFYRLQAGDFVQTKKLAMIR